MATNYKVRQNQSICDVIIQVAGSLEAGMQFCKDNDTSITSVPDVGHVFSVSDEVLTLQDSSVLKQFRQNEIIIGTLNATPQPAHIYNRVLTINHTLCGSSDSVDFPVLVSISDNSLKTIANGGHVCGSDGNDILFFKDIAEFTKLAWEIESYDGASGTIVAWVRLSTVTCGSDTIFYMQYGDPSLTTFQGGSAGSVWNDNYIVVYHLANPLTADATTNNQILGDINFVGQVAGKIGGGASFSSVLSQSLWRDSIPGLPQGSAERSMTCWFKMAANQPQEFAGYGDTRGPGFYSRFAFYYNGSNELCVEVSGASSNFSWTYDTNWHKITAVLPAGAVNLNQVLIYFDGVLQTVTSASAILITTNQELSLGQIPAFFDPPFYSGLLDEVRVMDKGISADWEIAEYNNQANPGNIGTAGFISYGDEY